MSRLNPPSFRLSLLATVLAAGGLVLGCAEAPPAEPAPVAANPFLAEQAFGKEDTGYTNPDGIEVEVDLEADIEASAYQIARAPAELGQFAVTYLRTRGDFYLESLAEHVGSRNRVEWRVDGVWKTAEEARTIEPAKLKHFRIRGVNAVLLHRASEGVTVGKVFTAEVPLKPYSVLSEAGDKCAEKDDHIGLSQSVYWYQWNPDLDGCVIAKQELTLTVSRMFQAAQPTYPEYDKLVADGKLTAVVLFGQIGDGAITDRDPGVQGFKRMGTWLKAAGFKEVAAAPVGKRYGKTIGGVGVEVDLYSPYDFAGLDDSAHFANFQRGLSEHEIVVYDGHSMLGASDFWSKPTYPSFYQMYLYGGCLGYEYYVKPIVEGKGGFENLDIVSSVVEVTATAIDFAGPIMAKIFWALENGYKASWKDILVSVRRSVGDSTFGASGVRDNCFTPTGTRCQPAISDPSMPDVGEATRYESTTALPIPDNNRTGLRSVINVPETFSVANVAVEVKVAHSWAGDLYIALEHGGKKAIIWNHEGDSQDGIDASFDLGGFANTASGGDWTLRLLDNAAEDVGTLEGWTLVLGR